MKIGIVASVTQQTLGLVSCSPCRPQGAWQTCMWLSQLWTVKLGSEYNFFYLWELLKVSSAWAFSVLKHDVKTLLELRFKSESSAVCCLVRYSAFWHLRSGGQLYRQMRGRKVQLAWKSLNDERNGLLERRSGWTRGRVGGDKREQTSICSCSNTQRPSEESSVFIRIALEVPDLTQKPIEFEVNCKYMWLWLYIFIA